MRQKIILALSFLLLIVAVSQYRTRNEKAPQQYSSPSPQVVNIQQKNTVKWLTHENQYQDYSIKYPEYLTLNPGVEGAGGVTTITGTHNNEPFSLHIGESIFFSLENLEVKPEEEHVTLNDLKTIKYVIPQIRAPGYYAVVYIIPKFGLFVQLNTENYSDLDLLHNIILTIN